MVQVVSAVLSERKAGAGSDPDWECPHKTGLKISLKGSFASLNSQMEQNRA